MYIRADVIKEALIALWAVWGGGEVVCIRGTTKKKSETKEIRCWRVVVAVVASDMS